MKRLALAAFLLAIGGCVDLKASYPERRFYTLEAARSTSAGRAAPAGTVLRVRRFTSSKVSEGSEFVTRTGESEYETDFYRAFFAPPATQLTEQAQRWLGGSRLFANVVGTGSSVPETHVLESNLIALHADGRAGRERSAVVEIQFMLVAVASDPPSVLHQKTYREEVAPGSDDPEALVRAWNDALARILASLEADVSKVDRKPGK